MIVTYKLEMKRFYSLEELTSVMKNYLKHHKGMIGLFVVSPESVKFSGRFLDCFLLQI